MASARVGIRFLKRQSSIAAASAFEAINLLTPATPDLVDCLASYGVETEDMEDEGVALDWTWGSAVMLPDGRALWPVIVQDGDTEPKFLNGATPKV